MLISRISLTVIFCGRVIRIATCSAAADRYSAWRLLGPAEPSMRQLRAWAHGGKIRDLIDGRMMRLGTRGCDCVAGSPPSWSRRGGCGLGGKEIQEIALMAGCGVARGPGGGSGGGVGGVGVRRAPWGGN